MSAHHRIVSSVALATVVLTALGSQAAELGIGESEMPGLLAGCQRSPADLYRGLTRIGDRVRDAVETQGKEEAVGLLYASGFEGELVTLLVPYVFDKETTLAGMAQSCWMYFEDWRRSLAAPEPGVDHKTLFERWPLCVRLHVYKSSRVIDEIRSVCASTHHPYLR